jgi:hypothetical protein
MEKPNHSMQRTEASRSGFFQFLSPEQPAPTADAHR